MAYNAPSRPKDFGIRPLSTLDLDRQISSDGATWLDREMVSDNRTPMRELGFGREASEALLRRGERLVEMGLATNNGDRFTVSRGALSTLEGREVERVGKQMAAERGLTYIPSDRATM